MVTEKDVLNFRDEGYICPVSLLSEDQFLELRAWFKKHDKKLRESNYRALIRRDGFIIDFMERTRIVQAAQEIYNSDVWFMSTRGFPKAPAIDGYAEYYAWHQDAATWGVRPPHTLSIWCALTDSNEENGCIQVIPGSHLGEILPYRTGEAAPGNLLCIDQELDRSRIDESSAVPMELNAGECSIHDSRILHYSGPNRTSEDRFGVSWIFAPVSVNLGTGWQGRRLMERK